MSLHKGRTSPKPRFGLRYVHSDEELLQPLTDEEREYATAALKAGDELREALRQKYGVFSPPSWVLINEAREERTEQLL